MILLDENLFESQRQQLSLWRIRVHQIGNEVARKGLQDDEIVALLRTLRRPTFFSRDRDFFKKSLCHDRFCIVYLDVRPLEVAKFVRSVLRHREFKSWSLRKGCVARVTTSSILVWRRHGARVIRFRWVDNRH